jgi:hypothetical protein
MVRELRGFAHVGGSKAQSREFASNDGKRGTSDQPLQLFGQGLGVSGASGWEFFETLVDQVIERRGEVGAQE